MKKGFTLVELLAVIILLGILGLIVYPTVNGIINTNKQKLHNKQIDELIRHGNTYATANITKLKTHNGARNIVKFKDLYDMGLIQNEKIIDPLNDQELEGCLILTWQNSTNSFDVAYDKECINKPAKKCIFNGELVQGAEFIDGQYTYRYKQFGTDTGNVDANGVLDTNEKYWYDMTEDGWSVILTDKKSSSPVTTDICTSINDKPIISMNSMFSYSQATSLDFSSFDTSNVIDMGFMFAGTHINTLDLSNFDTSNVTNMSQMFNENKATTINLDNFDTSKVTSMYAMFYKSEVTTLNLKNFNTSNVTSMNLMFRESKMTTLDLSNFDTSNVKVMNDMFRDCEATTINVSSFNTSNVTDMSAMFADCKASTLDLSSFDFTKASGRINGIFARALTTVGYTKNQADADLLNASTNKPSTLTFVVK